MQDEDKTKEQLINELVEMRQRIAELEALEIKRNQAEEALRRSELMLQSVAGHAPFSIWMCDGEGTVIFANQAAMDLFGVTDPVEIISHYNIYRDTTEAEKPLLAYFERAWTGEVVRYHQDLDMTTVKYGTTHRETLHFHSTLFAIPAGSGQRPNLVMVQEDITERRRLEEALRESEDKYRTIFETTGTAAVIIGEDTTISLVNSEFEKLCGYSKEELEHKKSWTEFVVKDDLERMKEYHRLRRTTPDAAPRNYEFRFIDRQGNVRDIFLVIAVIPGTEKSVASLLDITERKQAEEALRKAHDELETKVAERTQELAQANIRLKEMDRIKSEFLATMSHELRTPLNSIIGFTGIILQGIAGELNEEQRKQLNMVNYSAKHLLDLINDILDLSRIESGRMEVSTEKFKIQDVVSEVTQSLSPMISQKGLRLITEIPDETPEIYSDRKKVFQILLNLVNNAVKFTPAGEVRIECKSDSDNLEVSVADTGIGIKEEAMKQLFEAFRQIDGTAQRRYQGAGLGLYLCQKLVTLLGGNIWAESEYGKGSRFTFTLPLRREERGK